MSKNYAIIIHSMLPLTTFYRSGAHRSDVYKWDAFVTSWRFYNRAWQPQRHDRLPETSGTLWIHRGALTNQRCSLATGCGIKIGSRGSGLVTMHEAICKQEVSIHRPLGRGIGRTLRTCPRALWQTIKLYTWQFYSPIWMSVLST